jgi:hypothetical protein
MIDSLREAVRREPVLVTVGLAGLAIGLACLVVAAVRGRSIPPEGHMLDAATFCAGVGIFTLTIALLLPAAEYSSRARVRWRWIYLVFAVYGLTLEPLQSYRGIDPRFTEVGDTLDTVAGIVFGITAALNTVVFVVLGLRFFRSTVMANRPTLRLGIRYGAASVALSFGVGILMSVASGREIGDDGNLLLAHGLGVHGLQTVPLVALILEGSAIRSKAAWVHVIGIGWLTAAAAALIQALLGRAPFDPLPLTPLLLAGLALWAVGSVYIAAARTRHQDVLMS